MPGRKYKIALLLLAVVISNFYSSAQKVIRKGVTPIRVSTIKDAPNFEMEKLTGKWQEWKRIDLSSKDAISFKDTMMLNFNKRNNVEIRDGISMAVTGEAYIEKSNSLILAGDDYSIVNLNNNGLVITDGTYQRHLKKRKAFYYESFGKAKPDKEDYSKPVKPNPAMLSGKWDVYRRQAAPGFVNEHSEKLIKSIQIGTVSNTGIADVTLAVYGRPGSTESLKGQMQLMDTILKIQSGNHHFEAIFYKSTADELIFGEPGGLMYFLKKL